jgi:hypothetical protein
MNSSLTPNKQFNSNDPEKQKKLDQMLEYQLELQQKLLTKIKQLEESSSLIESLKSLNKNSKCLNSSRSPVLTRTGPYGYIPGKYDPSMFQEALNPFYLRIGNFK